MGGQVYETLADQLLKQGRAEGKLEGKLEGEQLKLLSMIDNLVNSDVCSFEKACEIAEITPAEYEEIKERFVLQP